MGREMDKLTWNGMVGKDMILFKLIYYGEC